MSNYTTSILWVDLTEGKIVTKDIPEKVTRKYIGGSGLAAKILWDETDEGTEPLSEQNPLIFMTGPLTGVVPSSSRYTVAAISPLTGIWGCAYSGGVWGSELRRAGFDGIVFKGKAAKPVYLWVHEGHAKIIDASHLWGKDIWEADDILKGETDSRASIAAIGRAGEKLVRIAGIINDGRVGRAAARCGLGAVMGSKNLKAIAVRGTAHPYVNTKQGLGESLDKLFPTVKVDQKLWGEGVKELFKTMAEEAINVKNFREATMPGFGDKFAEEMTRAEAYFCWGCRYSCAESRMFEGVRHTVGEALIPLGSGCLIDNVDAINMAYNLCNRYGLDTISTGGVIAFGMELFEKGLIKSTDTDGIELKWGNSEAMVEMVRKIGEREGFGAVLGDGVRRAAKQIGGIATEYAMHVKGLEISEHDPRGFEPEALEIITNNKGACHMEGSTYRFRLWKKMTALHLVKALDIRQGPTTADENAQLVAKMQDFMALIDSLVVCKFLLGSIRSRQVVLPSYFAEWLGCVTGWDTNVDKFLKTGERIFNLKRLFNIRRGISRKDDMLPPRLLTHKRHGGATISAEKLPRLGLLLNRYYSYREWSEEGIPTGNKLKELDLIDELAGAQKPPLSQLLPR